MEKEKQLSAQSELDIIQQYQHQIINELYHDHSQIKKHLQEVLNLPYANKPEYARHIVFLYQVYFNLILLEYDYYNIFEVVKRYFETAAPLYDTNAVLYYQHIGGLSCWLGVLFNNTAFFQKSIVYCNLALNELLSKEDYSSVDYARICWCYEHLGRNYMELRNFTDAAVSCDAALFWNSLDKNSSESRPLPHLARARIKLWQNLYAEAIYDLRILSHMNDLNPNMQIDYSLMQGEVEQEYHKNPEAALHHYMKALEIAEQFNFQQKVPNILLLVVSCYEQLDNTAQALHFYQYYANVKEQHTRLFQTGYARFLEQMISQLSFAVATGEKKLPNSFESFLSQKIDLQQHETEIHGATSILNCILANLSYEQLDAAWLAQQLYTSERSLHRKVVQLYNMPPKKLIQTIRLQAAKTLLETRFVDVPTVSMEVGFSTPSYFSKAFKRAYGISPYDIQQAQTGQ